MAAAGAVVAAAMIGERMKRMIGCGEEMDRRRRRSRRRRRDAAEISLTFRTSQCFLEALPMEVHCCIGDHAP